MSLFETIKKLEVIANSPDRAECERELFRKKAEELRQKISFENYLPDFSKSTRRTAYTHIFEPLFRGTKVDITA
jgi:hypothetical protein